MTKYALSDGIEECRFIDRREDGWARVSLPRGPSYGTSLSPRAYALTRPEAVKQAEAMRAKKIASLEKQIAKLRAMTFA